MPEKSARILIVYFSHQAARNWTDLLAAAGYEIDNVETPEKALTAAKSHSYDLILLDAPFPESEVFSLTTALRTVFRRDAAAPPIAVLTRDPTNWPSVRTRQAGIRDVMARPSNDAGLLRLVAQQTGPARSDHAPSGKRPPPPATPADDLLSEEILSQLEADTTPARLPALIAIYLRELEGRTSRIKDAMDTSDLATVEYESHALRSSSGSFGAVLLQKMAERTEQACLTGNLVTAVPLAQSLVQIAEATAIVFRQRYAVDERPAL